MTSAGHDTKEKQETDVLDRFGKYLDRCLKRACEQEILDVLLWVQRVLDSVEVELRAGVAETLLENHSIKKYKRVVQAYTWLPNNLRPMVLGLLGAEGC